MPVDPGGDTQQGPTPSTNRGPIIIASAIIVAALIIVVTLLVIRSSTTTCADWKEAVDEYANFLASTADNPNDKALFEVTARDLAEYQGYVTVDGERIEKPPGC